MNYFHLEAKVVSRGAGRSVIAAAAYASCSRLYNDYDGLTHDYTRKHWCLYSEVFLPQYAPEEWKDRQLLWEAVESVEKTKDSRLARALYFLMCILVYKHKFFYKIPFHSPKEMISSESRRREFITPSFSI